MIGVASSHAEDDADDGAGADKEEEEDTESASDVNNEPLLSCKRQDAQLGEDPLAEQRSDRLDEVHRDVANRVAREDEAEELSEVLQQVAAADSESIVPAAMPLMQRRFAGPSTNACKSFVAKGSHTVGESKSSNSPSTGQGSLSVSELDWVGEATARRRERRAKCRARPRGEATKANF